MTEDSNDPKDFTENFIYISTVTTDGTPGSG